MSDTHPDTDDVTGGRPDARADICAGAVFVAFGAGFAIGALRYDLGTALNMGPGYLPLLLGATLAVLGLAIAGQGLVRLRVGGDEATEEPDAGPREEPGPVPWVPGALLVAAILVFGFTVRGLGLALALFAATFLAALAGPRTSPIKALVIAAGLTVLCLVIFVLLLQLRLPLLGEWLGG